jgi:hypothetical protein
VEKKLLVISLIVLTLIGTTPTLAFMKLGPDGLEVDGEVLGTPIEEKTMEDMRGGYLGISFSVIFEGFWDNLGNYTASIITGGNVGPGSTGTTSTPPPNTAVKVEASVGGFNSSKGIFLITQVPGSNNQTFINLSVNINILQVLGNTLPTSLNINRLR